MTFSLKCHNVTCENYRECLEELYTQNILFLGQTTNIIMIVSSHLFFRFFFLVSGRRSISQEHFLTLLFKGEIAQSLQPVFVDVLEKNTHKYKVFVQKNVWVVSKKLDKAVDSFFKRGISLGSHVISSLLALRLWGMESSFFPMQLIASLSVERLGRFYFNRSFVRLPITQIIALTTIPFFEMVILLSMKITQIFRRIFS